MKRENVKSSDEYILSGTSSKDYITALYNQSGNLSDEAIRRGVDTISEQMKKDILNTPNTAEIYAGRMTGTTYYISEKNGSDENDGLSPETAVKTYAALAEKLPNPVPEGTSFLFERGGIYRGQIVIPGSGITIGSYGDGPKPLIMQSRRNFAAPELWVETEWKNVWKCTESFNNVGIMGFDHDLFDYSDASYDELYGEIMNYNLFGFMGVEQLEKDLQFYSVLANDPSDKTKEGELYLYSDKGNPGTRFRSIEIGEKQNIIAGSNRDVVIDNLAFKFTGAHAVGSGTCSERVITNCVFSWLGGSVLAYNFRGSGKPVNYGNAVEVYGGCNGYRVENCWMYQIYDTAVTHQYSDGKPCTQEGVRYHGLLMEYCHWGIEFYNNPGDGSCDPKEKYTRNVRIAYNVCRTGGMGWGTKVRYRTGRLYCGSSLSTNEDELTEYNIFDRCHGNLLTLPKNANEVDDKNIYIQIIGEPLGRLKGTDVICDANAAEAIAEQWGDKNAVVITIEPETQTK